MCALCARPGSNMGLVGQDFGENVHVYSRPGPSLLLGALVSSHRELFDLELRLEALVDDARVPAEVVQRPDAGRVFRGQVLVCAAPQQDGAVRRGGQGYTKRAREEMASSTSLVLEKTAPHTLRTLCYEQQHRGCQPREEEQKERAVAGATKAPQHH